MLRILLILYIFAPLKKENDMAEIANRMRKLITDIIDKNEHYDT